jgi:Rieske Fe-S protein
VTEFELDAESKERAAGGVLAFSAICTHQNCEAKTYVAAEKALVCFCHATKFLVMEAGRVSSGPAPRALPMLPLKLQGDQLAVAGSFTTSPGGTS